MVVILGFDPGLDGAIALVSADSDLMKVWDMPSLDRTQGKGREVNPYLLSDIVDEARELAGHHKVECVIEQVGVRPGEGAAGAFKFGDGFGVLRGVVGANHLTCRYVRPQVWKKYHGLLKKEKSASRALAMEKWPESRELFVRVKDADRAEAALLAQFGLTVAGWKVE
jgi:crossover junction endodeoxyribonuclease RuvC